ncbi:NUDIX hydrolase N-terminal domain-containing protein [Candidatus Leptofilum sp.]|uniref:NUDIX hydrolase N-terminal domain-containing protein n=1 Tax=Candidatus Leptofilum sp. TaxID=3241576 RepID=UPI003B5A941A
MTKFDPDDLKKLFDVPPETRLAIFRAEALTSMTACRGYADLIKMNLEGKSLPNLPEGQGPTKWIDQLILILDRLEQLFDALHAPYPDPDVFTMLDEIQAIARTGLNFTSGQYDRERYERLLQLSVHHYSKFIKPLDDTMKLRFAEEAGYITPKVGADAAIFNEKGEILLMERADGSGWCLPCGWVEANERPIDAAIREVREETGLEVEVTQFVGVFTRKASAKNGPHTMVAVVHLCKIVGGELQLSHEGSDLRYWPLDEVEHWHPNHDKYAHAAHKMWQSETLLPAISD